MQPDTGLFSTLSQLVHDTQALNHTYKPLFFKLDNPEQKKALEHLLETEKGIQVFDYIDAQVNELIRCIQPAIVFMPPAVMQDAIAKQFQDKPKEQYGIWVYYPWNKKLVHILDEPGFSIVRTNRNKYKITAEEQELLSQKKIGVMGLSVGQSVSLTLAMERSFGELRIADFDELDLSNINRIRSGVQNLKIRKTVIVAREIAEIDPFLNVVCFNEGITAANLDTFLEGNGKLDLLIDECDSFDIKISARKKAKVLGIPVLMEGSDRCTIDIERFDLEPDRAVLHGMVEHLDMEKYGTLTTMDEKVPYITAVTGVETLSPRMKGSAVEIMSSISTWPQLASAVTLGGGVTADLSRRILLDTLHVSGRFFLDMEELIRDEAGNDVMMFPPPAQPITIPEMEDFIDRHALHVPDNGTQIDENTLRLIIQDAQKAPSGGNNQPWLFHLHYHTLHLFTDESATGAFLDPESLSSYISLGAAIENLLLSAAQKGLKVNWELTPDLTPTHIAWFNFEPGYTPTAEEQHLAAQIRERHTNRKITPRHELDESVLISLEAQCSDITGARLKWISDPQRLQQLAGISAYADLLRLFIPEAYFDFMKREMRWNLEEVHATENGIGVHTLDLSHNDLVGMRLIKDRRTVDFLEKINGGSGFKRLAMQQFMASSAVGLLTMPSASAKDLINAGRAVEKIWLSATGMDLKIHPVNVPLIFFYKNNIEKSLSISEENKATLSRLENNVNALFENGPDEYAVFMFRLFKASSSPERTIRKSTSKIFSIGRA